MMIVAEIVESKHLLEQFRFPRSKKSRIRKKWALREINFRPSRKAYMVGTALVCHPEFSAAVRRQLEMGKWYPLR